MTFGFSYIGLIWLLMLLIPNFIWTKNQPKDYEKYAAKENKVLLALERSGEFIVTPVALIFSDFNFKGWNFWLTVLVISFLCMVLYEIYWIRYFKSEKTMKDFYRGILGIPVAGATLPVIAFFPAWNLRRKHSYDSRLLHSGSRSHRYSSSAQKKKFTRLPQKESQSQESLLVF